MSEKEYMSDKEYVANIPNLSNKKLIDGLESCGHDNYYNVMYYPILKEIKKRLSKERKKGKWVYKPNEYDDSTYECSQCGEPWTLIEGTPKENNMNYCPNCGAEMTR